MTGGSRNLAASVRQRLLNLSKERVQDFNVVLTQYAIERLLYRISRSDYANRFILKGAMLFVVWTGHSLRPTRDLDLLGFGDGTEESLLDMFTELCRLPVEPDGVEFVPESIGVSVIREAQEYGGLRVSLEARLENARIPVQVDVGFGDAITPMAEEVDYPSLLGLPAPKIRVYSRETVVAEKLQAMVSLGLLNSRMKDFYDIYLLARRFDFDGDVLVAAIKATFDRRRTPVPSAIPVGLTDEFVHDASKIASWQSFVRRMGTPGIPADFGEVAGVLREFLASPLTAASSSHTLEKMWQGGGPWSNRD